MLKAVAYRFVRMQERSFFAVSINFDAQQTPPCPASSSTVVISLGWCVAGSVQSLEAEKRC